MAEEAGKATETAAAAPAASEPGSVPVAKEEKAGAPSVFDQAWQPFLSLRREMDQLFDDFLSRTMTPFGWGRELDPFRRMESVFRPSVPAVDLVEREKEYVVTAELPGLDEKALELKLSGDTLSIRGQKQEERKEEHESYRLSERRYGSFQRSLRLPQDIDSEKIDARFTNGVLTITLPKNEEALKKQRKIEVKAS